MTRDQSHVSYVADPDLVRAVAVGQLVSLLATVMACGSAWVVRAGRVSIRIQVGCKLLTVSNLCNL